MYAGCLNFSDVTYYGFWFLGFVFFAFLGISTLYKEQGQLFMESLLTKTVNMVFNIKWLNR